MTMSHTHVSGPVGLVERDIILDHHVAHAHAPCHCVLQTHPPPTPTHARTTHAHGARARARACNESHLYLGQSAWWSVMSDSITMWRTLAFVNAAAKVLQRAPTGSEPLQAPLCVTHTTPSLRRVCVCVCGGGASAQQKGGGGTVCRCHAPGGALFAPLQARRRWRAPAARKAARAHARAVTLGHRRVSTRRAGSRAFVAQRRVHARVRTLVGRTCQAWWR